MSGCVAAAAALHLLPASMGTAVPPQTGLVAGSFGLSREDLKLLADSDSETEVEGEPSVSAAAALPAAAPVPLQRPKQQLDPGPVHKYKWEEVRKLDMESLVKEGVADRYHCPALAQKGMGSLEKERGIAQQGRERKSDCRDEGKQSAQELANEFSCGNLSPPQPSQDAAIRKNNTRNLSKETKREHTQTNTCRTS